MPQRVLITGAGGFVGAALARRLLAAGSAVVLGVRPGSDMWRLDDLGGDATVAEVDLRRVADVQALFAEHEPQCVFHLAAHGAYSWQADPVEILETNVLGSANLVEAVIGQGCPLVQAGSSSEYGFKDHAPAETDLAQPNSAYAVGKLAATTYGQWAARERGAAVTTLRLYSVYGPWEQPGRLIPTLVEHCLRGELPPLADPGIARDFVYVDDVCEAFTIAAEKARPGDAAVYNIGTGSQTTLADLVDTARRELGVDREPQWGSFPPRVWDTDVWHAEPRLAASELGWRARCSTAEGLRLMAEWMRSQPSILARYSGA